MKNELINLIEETLKNSMAISFIALIVFLGISLLIHFRVKFDTLRSETDALISFLFFVTKHGDKSEIEKKFFQKFDEFDQLISNSYGYSRPWSEYKETFVKPIGDEEQKKVNTVSASRYFDDRTIFGSNKIDIRSINNYSNVLVGVGILGTFLGLSLGVSAINIDLKNPNIEQTIGSIQVLLDNAGVAFTSSLMGILASILFSFWEKRNVRILKEKVAEFQIQLDMCLKLVTVEEIQYKQLLEQKSQTELLKKFVGPIADLGNSIQDQNKDVLEKMLKDLASEFNEKLFESFGENFKRLDDAIHGLVEWQEKQINVNGSILGQFGDLDSAIQNLNSALPRFVDVPMLLEESLNKIQVTIAALEEQRSNVVDGLSAFAEVGQNAGDFAKQINEFQNAFENNLSNFENRLDSELSKVLQGLGNRLVEVSNAFVDDYEPLAFELKRIVELAKNCK